MIRPEGPAVCLAQPDGLGQANERGFGPNELGTTGTDPFFANAVPHPLAGADSECYFPGHADRL